MKKRAGVLLMLLTMMVSSLNVFAYYEQKTFSNVTMRLEATGGSTVTIRALIDDSRGRYVDGTIDIRDIKTRKQLFREPSNWRSNSGYLRAEGTFAAPNTLDCYLYAYVDNGNWDDYEIINFDY